MPPSEVEKIFRAFAEERKRELPQFTPDGIPITLENKFDDAIYNYLYEYWKTNSGEYDPKDDEIIMTKESSFTKNEKKFEQWLLQQYGMTKKEERGYTLEGNLDSLWEIFSAADMVLLVKALPNIGKNLAKLGKNVLNDVTQEATTETVERTINRKAIDTIENFSQKTVDNNTLKNSKVIEEGNEIEFYNNINEMFRKKRNLSILESMPKKQLQKIVKGFKRQGGIIQMDDATDVYLKSKMAEGITLNESTILLLQNPSRASVFEELIHATQFRKGLNDGSLISRLENEIEAQKMLLKNSKAYKLTPAEIKQTESALSGYIKELQDLLGGK